MTAALPTEQFSAYGSGWRAMLFTDYGFVAVDPDLEDVSQVFRGLLGSVDMIDWLSEWSDEDPDGWDVYYIWRDPI